MILFMTDTETAQDITDKADDTIKMLSRMGYLCLSVSNDANEAKEETH